MIRAEVYAKAVSCVDAGNRQVTFVMSNGEKVKQRLGRASDGRIIYMKKGSNRRGYFLNDYCSDYSEVQLVDIVPIISKTTIADSWRKSIDKAITLLTNSGLWSDILVDLKLARDIGFDNIRKAYDTTNMKFVEDYYENQSEITKRIKDIDARLVKTNSETGKDYYDTGILWQMAHPLKIKKMNFGKYQTANRLQEIKEALVKKEKIHLAGDNGYDVSFEYNPEKNMAWYSEEYRGCGNGHYYIALSDTHAVFWEDD